MLGISGALKASNSTSTPKPPHGIQQHALIAGAEGDLILASIACNSLFRTLI